MKYIKSINEKKPKGAPKWHDADWPDAEGRFKDLSPKDLAKWLIKTRKGDMSAISGSLTQQIVFNRKKDPEHAEKMEKTRKEVYKQMDRKDLLDKMDESLITEKKWSGEEVWDHIVSITPEEDDIPWGFEDDVTSNDFKMTKIDLKKLLKTDSDLEAYYKGGEQRYHPDDVSEYDLDFEIVVIDGELIDGYSRVSALLRNGERYAHGFVSEKVNIDRVEQYADKVMDPIDVEFTNHFFDRLTRGEHAKEITDAELIGFFKRLSKKKKQFDEFKNKYSEFVATDSRSDINIPFKNKVDQIIAKTVMRKKDFLSSNPAYTFEAFTLNEIGDASAKTFKYKSTSKNVKDVLTKFDKDGKLNSKGNGGEDVEFSWEFTNDEGVKYVCRLDGGIHKERQLQLSFSGEPKKEPKYNKYVYLTASFNLADRDKGDESQTNMHEQFRVLSTVVAIMKEAITDIVDAGFRIENLNIPPKGDSPDGKSDIDSKRGKFYLAYLKRSLKTLDGNWSVLRKRYDGQTYYSIQQGDWSGGGVVYNTNESMINEQDTYNDYPAAAKANAKKALEWRDKYGREEVDAGTAVGWARANQLAKGEKISAETISRMASFNRHRKNSKIADEYKDTPWKDRGYVAWLIWGGDEGVDWAMKKSKELNKMEESKYFKPAKSYNDFVNEAMDMNDPILIALRARREQMSRQEAARPTMSASQAKKLTTQLNKINTELSQLYAERNRMFSDMEQEAEMEGGPIADRYGEDLDKLDQKIEKLIASRKKIEVQLAQ